MANKTYFELEDKLTERFSALLRGVPMINNIEARREISDGAGESFDLIFDIATPSGKKRLLVEMKSEGIPRAIRSAAESLKETIAGRKNVYGVVAVPYISERGREICRELGVGGFDLAGNALIAFDQIYIERSNYPNQASARRLQRSLFAPLSTRILRVLLGTPARGWYVRDLASEAKISQGQASKVKRLLLEQDFISTEKKAIFLKEPEKLLKAWAEAYSYQSNQVESFYSLLSVPELEDRLAQVCEADNVRYGLTLFSGAEKSAPYARYNTAFAFVDERPEKIASRLEVKRVDSGANLVLLRPYDTGVFYGAREIDRKQVVSDIQLYLDLMSYKGRGEDAAEFLYERRIIPGWKPRKGNQNTL
jgi:hypothetical protein